MKKEGNFSFYQQLSNCTEVYTCCNKDWYITVFKDGAIDSFVLDSDEQAKNEYDTELEKIRNILEKNKKKTLSLKYKHK